MAAAPNPEVYPATNPKISTNLVADLIEQLRLYRPPSSHDGEEDDEHEAGGGADVDARGKVFSEMGMSEPAVPVRTRTESFRPKRAAVLVCLFDGGRGNGDLRVFLTKRSSNLSTHPGEVCLPGGKAEAGDADDAQTAMREAREEIGLDPSLVAVVAVLEPFLSRHLLRVAPVIGILSDKHAFRPVPNAAEVEAVFDAPLDMFLNDENRRSEERERMGEKFLVHYFDFETEGKKYVIWGLTARILIRAASVVYQRPPSFPEPQPKFKIPRSINGNCIIP